MPPVARPRPARRLRRTTTALAADDWRSDARAVALTDQITRLHGKLVDTMTKTVVEIGRRMTQIHDRLAHGQWNRWVEQSTLFERRTIDNYMRMFRFSRDEPRQFARFAHLGPSKLYVLASADIARVAKLKVREAIAIPGGGGRKTIDDMTVRELSRVVGDLAPVPHDEPPIGKLVQSATHKIAGLQAVVDDLVARADELPAGTADDLAQTLRALADELDAAD